MQGPRVARTEDGRIDVTIHQVAKDAAGAPRSGNMIHHIYTIKDNLVTHMEIRD